MKDYLEERIETEERENPEFAAQWAELQARKALSRLRKQRDLTQAQVAATLGLPQSRVADLERNPGSVSFSRIAAYAKAIGVSVEDIARVANL